MSFREKIHWATIIITVVTFGWYFAAYPWSQVGGPSGMWAGRWMIIAVSIISGLSLAVVAAVLALRNPGEAHQRADERDRTLHWRGTYAAYYTLIVGIWLCILLGFYGYGAEVMTNALLACFVVAELIRMGRQLQLYRRG